jgi:NTE family protein
MAGVLSNTPLEAVFDDNPRRDSLVFAVQLWNPRGEAPESMTQVLHRHKDVQYSSRTVSQMARQRQIHHLRHIISDLSDRLSDSQRNDPAVDEMASYGCVTQMHVVHLLAPRVVNEDHMKDIDFSRAGIEARWSAGYSNAKTIIAEAPWKRPVDPIQGLHLHEGSVSRNGAATN